MPGPNMTRVTISLPERAESALKEMSTEEGVSRTEILRRALALYEYLQEANGSGPLRVALVNDEGRPVRELVLVR